MNDIRITITNPIWRVFDQRDGGPWGRNPRRSDHYLGPERRAIETEGFRRTFYDRREEITMLYGSAEAPEEVEVMLVGP